jgi:hypothetical protein
MTVATGCLTEPAGGMTEAAAITTVAETPPLPSNLDEPNIAPAQVSITTICVVEMAFAEGVILFCCLFPLRRHFQNGAWFHDRRRAAFLAANQGPAGCGSKERSPGADGWEARGDSREQLQKCRLTLR